jgi:hypothetical protein
MSQQINLYNPAFEHKRQLFSARSMAAALGVLALGMGLACGYAQTRVSSLQAEAKTVAAQLEQAQARMTQASSEFAPRKPDPALQARLAASRDRLAALQKVAGIVGKGGLGNTQGYAEYFRALARQGMEGLWLTAVNVEGAGADIGVRGRALDPALVPGYIGRLRSEPVMQGKTIGSLAIDQGQAADGKDAKPAGLPFVEFQFQSAAVENKP